MKTKSLAFLLMICFQFKGYSAYYPLQCSGNVPSAFSPNYFEKACANFEMNKDLLPEGDSNGAREYYHSNQYFLRDLILSGNVIFGDPISSALQIHADRVAEKLRFKSNPRIFLLRSTEPNAFATQTGAIFFTTALICYMDNFQQLIYILCHEMAHVELDHLYTEFLQRRKIQYTYSKNKIGNLIVDYYDHSITTEFEADALGYKYFTSSGYNQSMAIESLENLDSSCIRPFYFFDFDSSIDLTDHLPGLIVSKYDIRPFLNAQVAFEVSTHPEFLERYDTLTKQKVPEYNHVVIDEEKKFNQLKKLATNETLLSYFDNKDYFNLISYYHLGDHMNCDENFLYFLYTKSVYCILKARIFIESERAKYDPNKIIVEYNGPLQSYLDVAEPSDFMGPERPFIDYFKKKSLAEHWNIGATEYLRCQNETVYFEDNKSFCQEYADIFDSLKIDTCKSLISYESMLNTKARLDSLNQTLSKNKSAETNRNMLCLVAPYYKKPNTSLLDQSKVNMEYYDSLIFSILKRQMAENNIPLILYSVADLKTTDHYNDYLALESLSFDRFANKQYEKFATCYPNEKFRNIETLRYIRLYQAKGGLAIYSVDLKLTTGNLTNKTYIEMDTSDDGKGKIQSVIKKYFKKQTSK